MHSPSERGGKKKGCKPFNAKKRENVSFGTNSEMVEKGRRGEEWGREGGSLGRKGEMAPLMCWYGTDVCCASKKRKDKGKT